MTIETLEKITAENDGALTVQNIIDLGGTLLDTDSHDRELWTFHGIFAERTKDDRGDTWTSAAKDLAGWFPDDKPEVWKPRLLPE